MFRKSSWDEGIPPELLGRKRWYQHPWIWVSLFVVLVAVAVGLLGASSGESANGASSTLSSRLRAQIEPRDASVWLDGNRLPEAPKGSSVEPNGRTWRYLHFWRQVAKGKVKRGDVMGRIGSTGNSQGAHLHLEMSESYEDSNWIYPGQWPCRFGK